MVIMDEISSIKTFFQSHSVLLSTAWLEGCVSWCKEENLPPNYAIKELQHKVFEQWLLLDLRDVELPCLPPDLSNKIKYVLNGDYSLQMMKVVDISKPKLWQLQRIRNNASKNTEPEIESSKRVLQLTLTDGVQEVEAMEYKPVSCLNLNLSPGIKIRLMGPITVRRGRLMLENKNVKILGGEVEELIVPNAAENVLAGVLKLPLNPKPVVIEENLLTANSDMFNEADPVGTAARNQNNARSNTINQSNSATRSTREIQQINTTNLPRRQNENQMLTAEEEEELRIASEIDMLMELERDFEERPANRKKSKTPDLFDDGNFNDSIFENIKIPPSVIETTPKPTQTPPIDKNHDKADPKIDVSLDLGSELFENFDIDEHLDQPTKESEWKPSSSQKSPVLTIEKLRRNIPNISNGKFKIRAKFNSVLEKLTLVDDEYYLVVKVEDETGDLAVRIHNDLISDFSGCCPAALLSLKTAVAENNSDAQKKVIEALRRIKENLLQLNHVVEVQIDSKEKFPIIYNILQLVDVSLKSSHS